MFGSGAAFIAEVEPALIALRRDLVAADAADPRFDHVGHACRVAAVGEQLAQLMGLGERQAAMIGQAAIYHDVGKLAAPAEILKSINVLSDDDWRILRGHSEAGRRMMAGLRSPLAAMARDIAAYHHEGFDGGGYPHGLCGDAIPLEARIVALADVYDALRSVRPYKARKSHDEVYGLILRGDSRLSPAKFDPAVLEAFARDDIAISMAWDCAALAALSTRLSGRLDEDAPAPTAICA